MPGEAQQQPGEARDGAEKPAAARAGRRRGSRGGRRHKKRTPERPPEPEAEAPAEEPAPEPEPKPSRRSRKRAKAAEEAEAKVESPPEPEARPGRRSRKGGKGAAVAEPVAEKKPTAAKGKRSKTAAKAEPAEAEKPARTRRRRREAPKPQAASEAEAPRRPILRARARIPVTGAPTDQVPEPFAHNAEYEFARILDFYGIEWQYEPRSFPLRWERGHVSEAFTPDFYLPDLNLYVEVTTLKSGLTAEKNRKMRLVKELYPEVNIILLKKRDYLRLLAKYGYGPLSPDQMPEIDRVLISTSKLQKRVAELGAQISRDYAGGEPVLVGVLRGVMVFMADLIRHVSVPTTMDLMAISSYEGNGAAAVRILKDLDENIKGRDVILVEDIVDTGMTLNHIIEYLQTKKPASIKVCTLLDKRARRLVNVPLEYIGFEIPDEFVVGYGLDFRQHFRNLPFIGILKHDLLP